MDSDNFVKLAPKKLFFRCAVPAMITSVFGALFSVADGLFTGRFIGGDALAAVNLIMPVIMIVEALSNMIATGSSVNISIMLGRKDREGASRIFSFSVKVILLFSCILGVIGFFLAKPFVQLLSPGASETAVSYAADYLRVYAVFAPVIPVYFAMDNYLRVCSKERLSMIIGIVSQVLNIVLDYIVVVLLGKGVIAVAITSCVSIGLGSVFMLLFFAGGNTDLIYTRDNISSANFLRIAANGFSEFFSSIATSVMSIVMNLFLLQYGGTTAVAAFSVVMYVDSIVGMLNFGLCDSLQPSISYCYGAGLMSRVKEIFRLVLIAASSTSLAAFLFMLTSKWGLNGVWLMPAAAGIASAILTLILACTLNIK